MPEPSAVLPAVNPDALAPGTDRTFALLELLSQHPDGLTVAEMTRMLHVAQNSVFRITKTLEARGYLSRRDRDKHYTLTEKLLRIAQPKSGGKNLVEEALPEMKRLRDETTESVVLSVRSGHEGVLILQVPASHVMKITWDMGIRTPLYNNAPGKVFLANAPEETRRRLIAQQEFIRWTDHTITDRRELWEHLLKVRELGYGTDRGEFHEGVHCVAAPISAADGEVAATICITGPAYRMPANSFRRLGHLAIQSANQVTERLRAS
jgi:IclR family transcriptional regulator, KDG regulon repressor